MPGPSVAWRGTGQPGVNGWVGGGGVEVAVGCDRLHPIVGWSCSGL